MRQPKLLGAAAACFITAAIPVDTQAREPVEHHAQTWFAVFATGSIHGNFWLWADAHARFHDSFEPNAVLLRPGLTWRARPDLFLTGGYGWTPTWTRTGDSGASGGLSFAGEHRIWEQVLWQPSDPRTGRAAQVRLRLEQRFVPESASDVGLRLRALVRGHAPLSADRAFIVVVWDELFLGLHETSWGQPAGIDQNRFFFGLGWQAVNSILRFELGYTNQTIVRGGGVVMVRHIAALNTFIGWPESRRRRR